MENNGIIWIVNQTVITLEPLNIFSFSKKQKRFRTTKTKVKCITNISYDWRFDLHKMLSVCPKLRRKKREKKMWCDSTVRKTGLDKLCVLQCNLNVNWHRTWATAESYLLQNFVITFIPLTCDNLRVAREK